MALDWDVGDDNGGVDFSQEQRYQGPKKTCSMCERHFRPGDSVLVDERHDLLFCAPDSEISPARARSCMVRWVMENASPVVGSLMIFVGES